jgi:hypothetical protein
VRYDVEGFATVFPRGTFRPPTSVDSTYCAYSPDRLIVGNSGGLTGTKLVALWTAHVLPGGQLWLVFSTPLLTSFVWQASPTRSPELAGFVGRLLSQRDACRTALPAAEKQEISSWSEDLQRPGRYGWWPAVESLTQPGVALPAVPGLDDAVWRRLCLVVAAASRGDRTAARAGAHTWAQESIESFSVASLYLQAALFSQMWHLSGHKPTVEEVATLSATAQPNVVELLPEDLALEDVLRSAVGLPVTPETPPGRWPFDAIAALGAILKAPQVDLPRLGPAVAALAPHVRTS